MILQKLAISYLETLKIKGESHRKNLSILRLILKIPLIWASCTCYPRFTNAYMTGRPVISNCVTPTRKVSKFLDSELKSVMQEGWSYILRSFYLIFYMILLRS